MKNWRAMHAVTNTLMLRRWHRHSELEQKAHRPEKLLLRVAGRPDQYGVVLVDQ